MPFLSAALRFDASRAARDAAVGRVLTLFLGFRSASMMSLPQAGKGILAIAFLGPEARP
jgi:hypothetical protein